MKRIALTALAVAAAGTAALVLAQPGRGILRLDVDGDGLISRSEFQLPDHPRGGGLMARADADGDGAVTREEFETALAEREAALQERMIDRFETLDADGDGRITRQEVADRAFARLDANADGYVSEDEARDRRRQRGGRGGPRRGAPGPGMPPAWSAQ